MSLEQQKIIIGITGFKESGKDTIGSMIHNLFPGCVGYRVGFGDALKQEIAELTGGSIKVINENKSKPELRYILQYYGTEIRRKFNGEDYWLNIVQEKIERFKAPCLIYIPDVRFENEVEMIKKYSGIIIKVDRIRQRNHISDFHSSETSMTKIVPDFFILNEDKGLRQLEWEVKCCVDRIKEKLKLL